jgi:hypothetical protein
MITFCIYILPGVPPSRPQASRRPFTCDQVMFFSTA